ncbi:hypothetical protein M2337_003292 [Sphingobium sp. B2D3A]|uniref:PEPxxWA-CTERM sorting domain-containing protein n=1 Tax=unclassified Sphingobium TaxID=2611147 RepID=UPI0022242D78|nr:MULTISPECIES: PEPxxWA-CTERM sorting domain-containing protein [unclassified Sphingobium]MCW2339059.1 hypothetical protein [Sphingobium sp. B2D3A]MCW2368661.1 hypothetical protein [Sphingobium sp. B11D3D]MCW2385484.1 hypothetical protein [Sphingobium sp. B2D3D]MCW2391645.1 hypothetical protein [Sphingobium sp. B11D3A]MCW2403400.1 hypothetical protein [Sphingobium sp. B1D7B]
MKSLYFLGTAVALALTGPAMAANLVTNGGFESGSFSGWSLSNVGGGTAPVVIAYGQGSGYPTGAYGESIPAPAGGGTYGAYFSSDTANPDSLSQSVNVVAGVSYYLSFDYFVPLNGYGNPFDASLQFLIDDVPAGLSLTAGSVSGTTPQTWYTFTTQFTATNSGPANLKFNFFGDGSTAADFVVDNVSMAAVPEPATWALMIGGFALAGMQLRRRRVSTSFA